MEGMDSRNGAQNHKSIHSLSEMFGYTTALRSRTQGRGTYAMEFDHYDDVPRASKKKLQVKNK